MSKDRQNSSTTSKTLLCKSFQHVMVLTTFMFLGSITSYAQPINDNPSAAIEVPVTMNNSFTTYTNELATNSMTQPSPSCGNYAGKDVWFKLTVPSTGAMVIELKTNVNPKVVMSLYKGTPGSFEEYTCSTESAQGNVSSIIYFNDITQAGDQVYLRVFRFGSNTGGEFKIASYVWENAAPVNSEPSKALIVNDKESTFEFQTYSTESSLATTGFDSPVCGHYKGGDIWFKSEVPMSGKLVVETNPGTIDPVVSVYTLEQADHDAENFSNMAYYDCSTSGIRDAGGEVIIDDPDLAGEEIMIQVFGDNDKWGGTFEMVVMEPRQDVCSDAIELTDIATIEEYVSYTNQYADVNGTEATCGPFMGKDIWFTVQVPADGELLIDTKVDDTYDVKPVLTAYTGTCGSLTQYACNFFGSTNPFGAKLEINDASLANQYIYLRMYAFNDAVGGAFQMSMVQTGAALPVELVSFRSQVVNNEAVVLDWETATELNNDYFIVEHSVDGDRFTPVGHITGNGTTNDIQRYTFEHNAPYFGENYYRLKQVDFDGQFEYSRIVTAIIKMEEAKINVFPNPVAADRGINIRWIGDFGREKTQLIITNTVGKQVFIQEIDVRNERESFIDLSRLHLNAGVYYLTVNDENSLIANQKINLVRD